VLAAFEATIQMNHDSLVSEESYLSCASRRRRKPLGESRAMSSEPEAEKACGRIRNGKTHCDENAMYASPTHGSPRWREYSQKASRTPSCESYCSPTEQETDSSTGPFEQTPPRTMLNKLPNSMRREQSGELLNAARMAVSQCRPTKKNQHNQKQLHPSMPPIIGIAANNESSCSSLPAKLPKCNSSSCKEPYSLQTKSQNRTIADPVRYEKKHYPKSPIPQKGTIKALNDVDKEETISKGSLNMSSDETSEKSIYALDIDHKAFKPPIVVDIDVLSPPVQRQSLSLFECEYKDPAVLLACKARPKSILLRRNHEINTQRHVKFLDMQPGGGRRMSNQSEDARDSKPLQPRRASLTLQLAHSSLDTGKLAATKIQALYRGYAQWKLNRVPLLELKIQRIERQHQQELTDILERKWKEMDTLRSEAVEEEQRLDSQAELANRLIDHLKRDSEMVRDYTKTLKEHCKTLRRSNLHCENMAKIQNESIASVNQNVEQLQRQQKVLRASELKLSTKIQISSDKLSAISRDVKREFQGKTRLKHTAGTICKIVKQRCRDDNLVGLISEFLSNVKPDDSRKAASDGQSSHRLLQSPPISGMDPRARPDQSIVSDVTKVYTERSTTKDEIVNNRSIFVKSQSFADYDPKQIVSVMTMIPILGEGAA
jgi:hypothetical protein